MQMTIRRINYTGRTRIRQEDVSICVSDKGPRRSEFVAKLNLTSYALPDDAAVFVEAYALSVCQRFSFGRIGYYSPPDVLCLSDFDNVDALKFRVKVVQRTDGNKHILAEADKIVAKRSDENSAKNPLLPVCPSPDLGQDVFRIEYSDAPLLQINAAVGDWKTVSTSPVFVALVYPSIIRQILERVLLQDEHDDTDDSEDWRSQWLRFALCQPNVGTIPDLNNEIEVYEWIDSVIDAFTRYHETLNLFKNTWTGGLT
jgi:hypothetical protein